MRQTPEQEAEYEILRKVLWDEPKESILKEARTAGLTPKMALAFYDKACHERALSIRRRGLRESLLGVLGLLVAVGVFAFYWYVIGGFTRVMLFWVAAPFTFGMFNLIRGLDRYFMPHWKRGSIACDP